MRGMMPVLSRFSQTVPPFCFAGPLRHTRHKRRVAALLLMGMTVPFGALAVAWFMTVRPSPDSQPGGVLSPDWLPYLFLAMYAAFFLLYGLYQLTFGTLQGKLIRPTRRGRLLWVFAVGSSPPACLSAWFLLGRWLDLPDGGFGYVFTAVAVCFFLAGVVMWLVFEPEEDLATTRLEADAAPEEGLWRHFLAATSETYNILRHDANFRRLIWVAGLFGIQIVVLPHYQAMARQELHLAGKHLMVWVITQNIAVGVFSLLIGMLADRHGYRLTMRLALFAVTLAPALAIALPALPLPLARQLFPLLYVFLAIVPLVLRTIMNYTLEISAESAHPRYLSTLQLGYAVPFLFSPLIGWLIDLAGFELMFTVAIVLTLLAGLMTFRLAEPRKRAACLDPTETVMEDASGD